MVAEDDLVAAGITLHMVHDGEYLGISATGRTVSVEEIVVARLRDGKIAEEWINEQGGIRRIREALGERTTRPESRGSAPIDRGRRTGIFRLPRRAALAALAAAVLLAVAALLALRKGPPVGWIVTSRGRSPSCARTAASTRRHRSPLMRKRFSTRASPA